MNLRHRMDRLEERRTGQTIMAETIDRPPQETKEQWLARIAGHPTPGLMNSRGETFDQWIARRTADLAKELGQ